MPTIHRQNDEKYDIENSLKPIKSAIIEITEELIFMGKKYTEQELNSCSKEVLITLLLSMQDQVERLNTNMENLIEQINIANQNKFGRKTEKVEILDGQMHLFNEAEKILETLFVPEPLIDDVVKQRPKKTKGKREADLKGLPTKVINHELTDEELNSIFGDKWKRLPDEVYKRLNYIPATVEVLEHHVAVYAGLDNQTMVKADRPLDLFSNSIATPSLVAGILNGKYVNALPYNRMEQEFKRNEINLTRQLMASWTIHAHERYLSIFYDLLHKRLLGYPILQADETTVTVVKDNRPAGSSSYMWIYRTGEKLANPIVLYDYQKTRKAQHPRSFLSGFEGYLVTDAFSVYQQLDREEELTVSACWSHARRRYANVMKALGKKAPSDSIAAQALLLIGAIYKQDQQLSKNRPNEELGSKEIYNRRQLIVKPLVDAYFVWVAKQIQTIGKGKTKEALQYSINQEKYLRVFLDHPNLPLDNNAAERSIRSFAIGRNNWVTIDTIDGAKASAGIYSIVETAKANKLKPYDYLKYLLEEIPKINKSGDLSQLEKLLPWSEELPGECRQTI